MKFFSFQAMDGTAHVGVDVESVRFDLTRALSGRTIASTSFPNGLGMMDLLRLGVLSQRRMDEILSDRSLSGNLEECRLTTEEKLLAPIQRPPKVIGVGMAYKTEAQPRPVERPALFQKGGNNVIGPGQAVVYKRALDQVVAEVELVIVIAKGGANIPEQKAHEHIAAYSVANDVTAREIECGNIWFDRKCISTFCPLGPCLVPFDEIGPQPDLRVALSVNGRLLAEARTSGLLYSPRFLIHHISSITALEVGDCILTGAPPDPPVVQPGDVMCAEIEKIGILENPIVKECPA